MQPTKRLKWEPAALMVLVLGLGLWIAFGPGSKPQFPIPAGSLTQQVQVGETRGVLEARVPVTGEPTVRLWIKDGPSDPRAMSVAEAEGLLGKAKINDLLNSRRNWVFTLLHITSYTSLAWIGIGLVGQLAFSGRMVLQWLTSEKHRRSVVTESFWWFSLFGGVTLFTYFIWRQDPVAIMGQASGIVIYVRNIRLLRKHARRARRDALIEAASTDVGGSV
ncbi:MAG TPA: lipid-A-disaccharide synthase N-terminal domain-containing protein [Phycisphaerales bacterium]|nr:lipid-A-disaccharide synthase N-terminal domain-containing protein [Phycisphaerales bacterium]